MVNEVFEIGVMGFGGEALAPYPLDFVPRGAAVHTTIIKSLSLYF